MLRKTRIRSLVAISALTGATILGGAGLAGAAGGGDAETDTLEPTSIIDTQSVLADDDELNTGEPEAPTLPDHAAQQAHDALAERFAGGASQDDSDDAETDTQESGTADDAAAGESDVAEEQGTHGARVSAVATSGSGEGHGENVSGVARQQGEERRQDARENRPERGDDDALEDDDQE
jgi:hypothetical protein